MVKQNKFIRASNKRIVNDKVLIICSGKTELEYFNYFKKYFQMELQNVSIKILTSKRNISMALVEEAIKLRVNYFEIWTVFDKDIDPEFDKAIKKAINNGIKCAFSNVAFEYWLLLHLADKSGVLSTADLNRELSRLLGYKYDKNKNMGKVCKNIMRYIEEAEKRARIRHEEHKKDPSKSYSDWCSCSTVYELTKRLREWSEL